MLKQIFLIGAMTVAAPALAQTGQTTPGSPSAGMGTPGAQPQSLPSTATTPGTTQAAPQSAPDAQSSAAATPSQIAQVVEQDFPKYSGGKETLTQTQFGAWMASLRSATEPGATADSPQMKTWITQAFAQADTDKSKSVTKAELTSFLTSAAG